MIAPATLIAALFACCAVLVPSVVRAQSHWTGIGAIGRTAMYMDTTTIVRDGHTREVWIRSVDTEPRTVVIGADTVTFNTVIALNVLDCGNNTATVRSVLYYNGSENTYELPASADPPRPVRPGTFLAALHRDVCRRR